MRHKTDRQGVPKWSGSIQQERRVVLNGTRASPLSQTYCLDLCFVYREMCAPVCQVPCSCPESRSTTVMPKGYRRVQCAKSNSQFNTSSMHFALSAQFNHTRQVDGVSLSVLETSHIRARLTEKLQLLETGLKYVIFIM